MKMSLNDCLDNLEQIDSALNNLEYTSVPVDELRESLKKIEDETKEAIQNLQKFEDSKFKDSIDLLLLKENLEVLKTIISTSYS